MHDTGLHASTCEGAATQVPTSLSCPAVASIRSSSIHPRAHVVFMISSFPHRFPGCPLMRMHMLLLCPPMFAPSSKLGPHNPALAVRPSPLGLHSSAFTTRPSTARPSPLGPHRSALTARPSQFGLHSSALTARPPQPGLHSSAFIARPSQLGLPKRSQRGDVTLGG